MRLDYLIVIISNNHPPKHDVLILQLGCRSPHLCELSSFQRLGQDICKLVIDANVVDFNLALLSTLPYAVILCIDVLALLMLHRVLTSGNRGLIVNNEHHYIGFLYARSPSRLPSHMHLDVPQLQLQYTLLHEMII